MPVHDEPIEVQYEPSSDLEAPARFLWRDRLWVVRDILARRVQADVGVWQVVAANGAAGPQGVYELAEPANGGPWRLSSTGLER
ncbi:MAG: hypothetical protein QOF52_852 [Propionibacteriaceae bacterium]|nr:hypothetical protein [Propionibacteriaceae bacterium]